MYIHKPFILVPPNATNVLAAGTLAEMTAMKDPDGHYGDYYSHCRILTREHDLYLNDNTKLVGVTEGAH